MISVSKCDSIPPHLCDEMADFELSFRYPLGCDNSFRISHGEDYGRFFRSIGKSRIYLARHHDSQVLGCLVVVQRSLRLKDSQTNCLYVGDLKLRPGVNGKVLYCLIREAYEDLYQERDIPQYCVVMDGTKHAPSDYSGRLGLPKFEKRGQISILRCPYSNSSKDKNFEELDLSSAQALSEELNQSDYSFPLSRPAVRSEAKPRAFALKDGSAVCVLEDTLASKRLYDERNREIVSGHFSSFQYDSPQSAVHLINALMGQLKPEKYPAFFFSVPECYSEQFLQLMPQAQLAQATVYGRNIEYSSSWQINTSEI